MATDAVREQILDAAARLLRSSAAPPMGEVARAAGVSRATLYRRFASTEALLDALAAERAASTAAATRPPRERLLLAARACFARHGIEGTAVTALVQEARVSTSTLYSLFGDKAGLLQALGEALAAELCAAMQAAGGPVAAAACLRAEAPLLRLLLAPGSPAAAQVQDALRVALRAHTADPIAADALLAVAVWGEGALAGLADRLGLSAAER